MAWFARLSTLVLLLAASQAAAELPSQADSGRGTVRASLEQLASSASTRLARQSASAVLALEDSIESAALLRKAATARARTSDSPPNAEATKKGLRLWTSLMRLRKKALALSTWAKAYEACQSVLLLDPRGAGRACEASSEHSAQLRAACARCSDVGASLGEGEDEPPTDATAVPAWIGGAAEEAVAIGGSVSGLVISDDAASVRRVVLLVESTRKAGAALDAARTALDSATLGWRAIASLGAVAAAPPDQRVPAEWLLTDRSVGPFRLGTRLRTVVQRCKRAGRRPSAAHIRFCCRFHRTNRSSGYRLNRRQ